MFVSKVYKLGFTSFRFVRIRFLSRSGLSSVKHFINGNPGKLKPEPLREFLMLTVKFWSRKRASSTIEPWRPATKTLLQTCQSGLNGWTNSAVPSMK